MPETIKLRTLKTNTRLRIYAPTIGPEIIFRFTTLKQMHDQMQGTPEDKEFAMNAYVVRTLRGLLGSDYRKFIVGVTFEKSTGEVFLTTTC